MATRQTYTISNIAGGDARRFRATSSGPSDASIRYARRQGAMGFDCSDGDIHDWISAIIHEDYAITYEFCARCGRVSDSDEDSGRYQHGANCECVGGCDRCHAELHKAQEIDAVEDRAMTFRADGLDNPLSLNGPYGRITWDQVWRAADDADVVESYDMDSNAITWVGESEPETFSSPERALEAIAEMSRT